MIDDVQLDNSGFQQLQRPPQTSLGWLGAGKRDQLCLCLAVKDALARRVGRVLAGQGSLQTFFHQLLSGASNGVGAGLQRLSNAAVAPTFTGCRCVSLQQYARLQ